MMSGRRAGRMREAKGENGWASHGMESRASRCSTTRRSRAGTRWPMRRATATGRRCSTALQKSTSSSTRHGSAGSRFIPRCTRLPMAARRRRSSSNCCSSVRGACCAMQTARARSISPRSGHRHLIDLLTPQPRRFVPDETLRGIQRHFHAMMLGRIAHLRVDALRLPNSNRCWNSTRGPTAYGSACRACMAASAMRCTPTAPRPCSCRSWSRVVGGSGQRHEITAHGCTLVEEGFV